MKFRESMPSVDIRESFLKVFIALQNLCSLCLPSSLLPPSFLPPFPLCPPLFSLMEGFPGISGDPLLSAWISEETLNRSSELLSTEEQLEDCGPLCKVTGLSFFTGGSVTLASPAHV